MNKSVLGQGLRIKELLSELPEPYKSAAISQMDEGYYGVRYSALSDLGDALSIFTDWESTLEGQKFWYSVHKALMDNLYQRSCGIQLPPYPSETIDKLCSVIPLFDFD